MALCDCKHPLFASPDRLGPPSVGQCPHSSVPLAIGKGREGCTSVRAGQQVRRKEMTAGPRGDMIVPSGKEGKSLAPIREVDRGGEITGPLPTWPGSSPQNFPLDFLEDRRVF